MRSANKRSPQRPRHAPPRDEPRSLGAPHLLGHIPPSQLRTLTRFFRRLNLKDGDVVFEEGSRGDSFYFVSSGKIRISKRVSGRHYKDLAILGPGACFGELALAQTESRSARASSQGDTFILELRRRDLNRWLKAHPKLAMGFMARLVQVQSQRLKQTSNELAMLLDLSHIFLESVDSPKTLMIKALAHVILHMEGSWEAAGYLYNPFNDEMDFVAQHGDFDFAAQGGRLPPADRHSETWMAPDLYYVSLPGEKRPLGFLLFHSEKPPLDGARNELGRALATVARLLSAALESINHRMEETLRERLKSQAYGTIL